LADDHFEQIRNKTTILSETPSSTLNNEKWLVCVRAIALCAVLFFFSDGDMGISYSSRETVTFNSPVLKTVLFNTHTFS